MSSGDSVFTLVDTYDLDTPGDADAVPYGYNTPLSAFPGSTVLNTTRGIVAAEIAAGTILDGRESSGGMPIPNPLTGTGTLYEYSVSAITAGVTVADLACSPVDIAPPFGVLDLDDVGLFVAAFVGGSPAADLAAPEGVLDLADIAVFVAAFTAGCP